MKLKKLKLKKPLMQTSKNFTSESDIKVKRMKEMISSERNSRLLNKFSLEMYREQNREIAH